MSRSVGVPGRRVLVGLLALVVVGVLVLLLVRTVGEDDPFAAYCDEVEDRRAEIGAALAAGESTGLLRALPSFEALAEKAPDDIRADWRVVVQRIGALQDALADAGVDAASYDREAPPEGLPEAERAAIDAAAVRLGSPETTTALARVEQQARDVCKTPLSL